MIERWTYFITWNTYGSWLPGDSRGWRKRFSGDQPPNPRLENWCRNQMNDAPLRLSEGDRQTVDDACKEHCRYRNWTLLAINVRTNHVHVIFNSDAGPSVVRNQLKANCTRRLRTQKNPLDARQPWAKGADVELLDTDKDIENCVRYVLEAQ
jgi:REP element-mobilizing transposase RayT